MPENAPKPKKDAVAGYDARITFCKPTLEARESTAKEVMEKYEKEGYTVRFVHPYDEPLVIAGQGTMALEMLDQAPLLEVRAACSHAAESSQHSSPSSTRTLFGSKNIPAAGPKAEAAWRKRSASEPALDIVIAPVGGGGMLSGVSTAIKGADKRIIVIGAEPDLVNDAFHSVQSGTVQSPPQPPKTICDGLLTSLSPLTLSHIQRNVDYDRHCTRRKRTHGVTASLDTSKTVCRTECRRWARYCVARIQRGCATVAVADAVAKLSDTLN